MHNLLGVLVFFLAKLLGLATLGATLHAKFGAGQFVFVTTTSTKLVDAPATLGATLHAKFGASQFVFVTATSTKQKGDHANSSVSCRTFACDFLALWEGCPPNVDTSTISVSPLDLLVRTLITSS